MPETTTDRMCPATLSESPEPCRPCGCRETGNEPEHCIWCLHPMGGHREILARIHRFLVEHGLEPAEGRENVMLCVGCGTLEEDPHAADCEWQALMRLTDVGAEHE